MCGLSLGVTVVDAGNLLDDLTENGVYVGPSVEDNIALMDTDKNGFADVFEVRAFLVLKHGKDYEKDMLDQWEASARGKSCSTPFAKDLYLK
jgi:hypothetical protein